MGAKCQLSGQPCDLLTVSCPVGHGLCVASGPGQNQFESTKMIATRIFQGAMVIINNILREFFINSLNSVLKEILNNSSGREVKGSIQFIQQFVDMPTRKANYLNPVTKKIEEV